jgi:hypothetical protein
MSHVAACILFLAMELASILTLMLVTKSVGGM